MYIYVVFTTEGLFEVTRESWPEWEIYISSWSGTKKVFKWSLFLFVWKYERLFVTTFFASSRKSSSGLKVELNQKGTNKIHFSNLNVLMKNKG